MNAPRLNPAERAALEALYAALCSALVLLARVLDKPNPIRSREERLADRFQPATSREG